MRPALLAIFNINFSLAAVMTTKFQLIGPIATNSMNILASKTGVKHPTKCPMIDPGAQAFIYNETSETCTAINLISNPSTPSGSVTKIYSKGN